VPIDYDDMRAHGKDERIRVDSFYQGLEFTTRLVRALAAEERKDDTANGQ
jgi:acetylornithine deacetylase/succinyl-diaminopimelate desuccinylase-like protein